MQSLGRVTSGLLLATLPAALGGCVTVEAPGRAEIASAPLVSARGAPVGWARLLGRGSDMMLQVEVSGLAQGPHGLHLHDVGRCDVPDFASAKGHWNPTASQHGSNNPSGPHAGDLPNLMVGANGRGELLAPLNDQATSAGLSSILDADGTAVIIHAGPDDMRTDPSGDSGARVVCGVLQRG